MILYIMRANDGNVKKIAVIDTPISVIWVRRYDTPGEFEIETPATGELWRILTSFLGELFVTREDSDIPMYIERIRLTEGANGDTILINGRTADAVLDSRVIGYRTAFPIFVPPVTVIPVTYAQAIRQLVFDNLINPTYTADYPSDPTARKLEPFAFDSTSLTGGQLVRSYCGENLLEAVDGLLSETGFGLQCRNIGGTFTFELLQGQDRPNVIFSHDNENLLSCEYDIDLREKCNVVFVNATGAENTAKSDGTNPYTTTQQAVVLGAINYKRREGNIDATPDPEETITENILGGNWEQGGYQWDGTPQTDINNYRIRCTDFFPCGEKFSVTASASGDPLAANFCFYTNADEDTGIGQYGTFVNGATATPPSNANYMRVSLRRYKGSSTLTPAALTAASETRLQTKSLATYKNDVKALGVPYQTKARQLLNVETVDNGLFRPYIDYFLGDTVHIITAHGVSGSAKVQEITEVEDAEGYRIYPTFSEWEIDS